jgi:hypothetical protein
MTKDEQLAYQRKVILEEYPEHIAIQKKEQRYGRSTFIRTPHLVPSRDPYGEKRAT